MGHEDRRLDAAVALGIITAAQAESVRAIAPESARAADAEAPRAVNAATLAYVVGAFTVVIGMLWFLSDRWEWLGAGGVIAVCALYAAVFLVTARVLRREAFPIAGGFAILLAVLMVPPATVALNELSGWFSALPGHPCRAPEFEFWTCRGEEVVAELATAAAALLALRKVRFSLLVVPLAVIALRLLFHVVDAFGRNGLGDASAGWVLVVGASLLAATAYTTDRRQRGDEDFALWLHLAAVACAIPASVQLLIAFPPLRHLMVPGAFVAFAVALSMRRVVWLLLGMGWFVGYLAWLANDVFRDTPAFPIALAALGVVVIIATVWVQRNAALLVRRFGTVTSDGRPRFPGGEPLLLTPVFLALLMLPEAIRRDEEVRRDQNWKTHRAAQAVHRQRGSSRAETRPLRRP